MTDRIDLKGLEVYAKHGVLEFEQREAQLFRVDVSVFLDLETAGRSDRLADTVDYGTLAHDVREAVGSHSLNLIEAVAQKVVDVVLADERVRRAIVTIHKPNAPVEVAIEDVSVTVDRAR